MAFDYQLAMFVLSTTVLLLIPGPTNTLLAAAGLGEGSQKALPLITFELTGYLIAISVWGIFLATIQPYYPWANTSIRVVCGGYLFYVAVMMWCSAPKAPISQPGSISRTTVFMATLLNPKGLLFASTIFPAQAFSDISTYLTTTALFTCLVVPIGTTWVLFGSVIGSRAMMDMIQVKRALAMVLCLFSIGITWTAISWMCA